MQSFVLFCYSTGHMTKHTCEKNTHKNTRKKIGKLSVTFNVDDVDLKKLYTECKYGGSLGWPRSSCAKARLVRPR